MGVQGAHVRRDRLLKSFRLREFREIVPRPARRFGERAEVLRKALHLEVGKKLLRQPELLEESQSRLKRMQSTMPYAKAYLERWEDLMAGPIEHVLRVLGADDEESKALRHVSPFAGVLSEQERLAVLRRQGLMR